MRNRFLFPSSWGLAATTTALLFALLGCGDSGTDPTAATGSIIVAAATTGTDLDGDGYDVVLDGSPMGTIGVNGTRTIDSLPTGSHTVALGGVAANCAASEATPQTVIVTAGQTTAADFAVACLPNVGTLQVITVTDGLVLDPDGYVVAVDGGALTSLDLNDTATITAPVGARTLALTGQATNCVPHGPPTASSAVAFGETNTVIFMLTCFRDPIVFMRNQDGGGSDLYVVDASGGPDILLTDDASLYHSSLAQATTGSAWNPARTHIAFSSFRADTIANTADGDSADLYVIALNKSEIRHLIMTGPQRAPTWSPDGSRLLFQGGRPSAIAGTFFFDVWVVNADLTGVTNLTQSSVADLANGWSPDGTRILLTHDATVYVMDADGSNEVNVSNADGTRGAAESDLGQTWSPDGTRILFGRTSGGGGDIWAVDPDGSNLAQLTNTPEGEAEALWSPDGSRVYFRRSNDVWVMDADGGNATQVTTSGSESLGSWNATTTFAGSVAAGTALVTMNTAGNGRVRLFIQAPDGSNRVALTAEGLDARGPHWR